jgi:micrococcal nuclease
MQFLPIWFAAAVAAMQLTPGPGVGARSAPLVVRRVVNGDTIDVATVGRVRLLGIDAPDVGRGLDTPAPFAREAKDRLVSLVLNRWVRLEQDAADGSPRHLAYVLREDGVFVNAVLVREGLARVSGRLPLTRLAELEHAQAEAQSFRRGMWGGAPQIPSAGYTRASTPGRSRPAKARTPRRPRPKTP